VRITRLELSDFRNYRHFVFEPSLALTVLIGPNAAGKTNAIEAVQLVTSTQSFRRPRLDQVVRWGAQRAVVRLRAEESPRLLETEMEIDETGGRVYRVNGQTRRRLSEVAGLLPSVVFTPDEIGRAHV
jgi:DNA replication and repair protein RecF